MNVKTALKCITIEQAIELEDRRVFVNADETINSISIYSMKKQIPKVPQIVNTRTTKDNYFHWVCPNCGASRHTRFMANYCSHCGQRIDWRGYLQTARKLSMSKATDEEIKRAGIVFPELKQEAEE